MSDRRDFMGMALGAFTGLGALGALYAAKRTWDPLPSVKAAGFTTLDLKNYKEGELVTEQWRGKPIFVMKMKKDVVEKAKKKEISNVKGHKEVERLVKVGDDYYMVCIGLCTHLGCIPGYRPETQDFLCACHGGQYDIIADVTKAPPPRGLNIPMFKLDGTKITLGEEGEEYKKMLADGITLRA